MAHAISSDTEYRNMLDQQRLIQGCEACIASILNPSISSSSGCSCNNLLPRGISREQERKEQEHREVEKNMNNDHALAMSMCESVDEEKQILEQKFKRRQKDREIIESIRKTFQEQRYREQQKKKKEE